MNPYEFLARFCACIAFISVFAPLLGYGVTLVVPGVTALSWQTSWAVTVSAGVVYAGVWPRVRVGGQRVREFVTP